MPRRSIDLEVRGLQTPRERVWAAIRKLQRGFTVSSVQDHCAPMVLHSCVIDYVQELLATGYLAYSKRGARVPGRSQPDVFDLVRPQFEAPRVNNGKSVTQGLGVLAMWRAIKVLRNGFNHREVAAAASVDGCVVTTQTAQSYVLALARAGYFAVVTPSKPGTPARYRLVRDTGPHAPAITRMKCVFDRNTGEFAQLETAQEVCDAIGN